MPHKCLLKVVLSPAFCLPITLLALAVEDKQKTRENLLRRTEPNKSTEEGRMLLLPPGVMAAWCRRFCLVSPAAPRPKKNPASLHFVSGHKFSCPCMSKFTFVGPSVVALGVMEASLTSQCITMLELAQWSASTTFWEEA